MKFNPAKLRASNETLLFILDFVMLALIISNLFCLVFDTFFENRMVQDLLYWAFPGFTEFYKAQIHPNFLVYDLIFVSVYLSEFVLRWIIAIRRKTYYRWFFYPFVHWYDLIGCIPVGAFRWLRLLRVFSIIYRLQKLEVLDISDTYLVRFVIKYVDVIMEEISDRVVVNVLSGMQDQIKTGNPMIEKIVRQIVMPHKHMIIEWIVSRVNDVADDVYQPRREDLRVYIDRIIADSIGKDAKVAAIDTVPVIGNAITEAIESTVSQIVFSVLDQVASDIGHRDTDMLVHDITNVLLDRIMQPSDALNVASKDVLVDVLELIKDEVRIQRWKLKDALA